MWGHEFAGVRRRCCKGTDQGKGVGACGQRGGRRWLGDRSLRAVSVWALGPEGRQKRRWARAGAPEGSRAQGAVTVGAPLQSSRAGAVPLRPPPSAWPVHLPPEPAGGHWSLQTPLPHRPCPGWLPLTGPDPAARGQGAGRVVVRAGCCRDQSPRVARSLVGLSRTLPRRPWREGSGRRETRTHLARGARS